MEVIYSKDLQTIKYIFQSGYEVSLKMEPSGYFDSDMNLIKKDNNKYSLILGCSVGCKMKCTFCHLTANKVRFQGVTTEEIIKNVIRVLQHAEHWHPELKKKNIKLCWMGSGEPLQHSAVVGQATYSILNYVFENGLAAGLDGVDMSTSYPWVKDSEIKLYNIHRVVNHFSAYRVRDDRSLFRLFYSLHAADPTVRDTMIPATVKCDDAVKELTTFCGNKLIDLIMHVTFIDGVNDSMLDVYKLIELYREELYWSDVELRVLRYNPADDSSKESRNIKDIIKVLTYMIPKTKIQYSSGAEVKAACGMFQ